MKRVALGVLAFCAMGFAQDNLAFWNKYKVITINTKASGANVANTVKNFPVLVRLDATNANDIFTDNPSGSEVRFGNAAGQYRPYQIESWDAIAKTAAVWVLADSVKGNDSLASLRVYWGRSGAINASSGSSVFDTAHGFTGVWHMNGSTDEVDVTANGLNAVPTGTVASATGLLGGARQFSGTSTYLTVANSAAGKLNYDTTANFTLSAWVWSDSISQAGNVDANNGHGIVTKGNNQYALAIYGTSAANRFYEITSKGNNTWNQVATNAVGDTLRATAGSWNLVTGTWSGATATDSGKIYVNGRLYKTVGVGNMTAQGRTQTFNVVFGGLGGGTAPGASITRPFLGRIDEVNIAALVRDSNWIKLTYQTQKPTANALSFGTAVTQTVTSVALAKFGYVDTNKAADTLNLLSGASVSLAALVRGGPVDSFKVVGTALPAGLTVNKAAGLLSGSAAATAAANYTIRAWGRGGAAGAVDSLSRTVRITVAAAASLSYSKDTLILVKDLPISPVTAAFTGGTPTYSVSPALPAGLVLNATTGTISGKPTADAAAATYVVKAKTSVDSAQKSLRITVATAAAENYATGWSMHKDIWLNTQSNGAGTSTGVGKFPVLVRLTAAELGTGTQPLASGADFRFTKEGDVVRLPHEIEAWDATAKTASIWVLLDTILANNGTQKFRLHWGNATAPNMSSGPSVFDTANGFQAVWHLNGNGNEADATPNSFTAVAANTPTSAAGAIGAARVFNGTNQYFSVPSTASSVLNFKQVHSYTLSAWINPSVITNSTNGAGHKIIDKGDNQYVLATYGPNADTRYWEITIRGNNTYNQCQANGDFAGSTAVLASSSVGTWNHLMGTYTGGAVGSQTTQSLYYNGKLVNRCVVTNSDTVGRNENYNVHLGVQAAGTAPGSTFSRYWQGSIDEPRLSSKARSEDWAKLEYANQKSASQSLVAFSAPVNVQGGVTAASRAASGLQIKSFNEGLIFQVTGLASGEKAQLSLVNVWGRTVFAAALQGDRLNWNGRANNGQGASSGLYIARLKITSADGRTTRVLEHRVPFTR